MIYMMCYDISEPKRLAKVAKILENYGLRVQKSFFQCEMPDEMVDELVRKVLKVIKIKFDRFFIYPLCEGCSKKAIKDGQGNLIRLEAFEIL